jgi:hypothetical protein
VGQIGTFFALFNPMPTLTLLGPSELMGSHRGVGAAGFGVGAVPGANGHRGRFLNQTVVTAIRASQLPLTSPPQSPNQADPRGAVLSEIADCRANGALDLGLVPSKGATGQVWGRPVVLPG